MAKIFGFNGDYMGLEDNEAWTRVYDVGKNLMPIRNKNIQKKYNNMFKKKTKVIRSGQVKSIKTDIIVPDDIIIIEKGSFIPVDGIILEENGLDIENDILFDSKYKEVDSKYYVEGMPVYQGMRVKSGRAVVETKRTGAGTFLGECIKEADAPDNGNFNRFKGYFFIIGIFALIDFILGFLFSFLSSNSLKISLISGLVMLVSTIPIGFIIVILISIFRNNEVLKKSRLSLKNILLLFNFDKLDVICIDSRFLTKDYGSYIQSIYKSGISIIVISENNLEEIISSVTEAGILIENEKFYSGKELDNMNDEQLINAVCDGVIFYNINHNQKKKIIKTFKKVKISTLCIGNGIEDFVSLRESSIGISSNHVKGSIDRELSDVLIWGNDFTSIYQLIKNKLIFKKDFIKCFYFNVIFQLPIIILLLVAFFKNINIWSFFIQWLAVVLFVVPIMLKLTIKGYSEGEIFMTQKPELSITKFFRMLLIGLAVSVVLIIEYLGLGVLINNEIINISIVMISMALFYYFIIKLLSLSQKEIS